MQTTIRHGGNGKNGVGSEIPVPFRQISNPIYIGILS